MLIGELARRSRVSPRSLRYYEQQGLLQSERLINGYRDYSEDAVITVRQIRYLLGTGFNSREIAVLLPCARGEQPEIDMCPESVRTVTAALQRVAAEARALRERERSMTAMLYAV